LKIIAGVIVVQKKQSNYFITGLITLFILDHNF